MSKADFYRRRHRKLMDEAKQEESWPKAILTGSAMIASCILWLLVMWAAL